MKNKLLVDGVKGKILNFHTEKLKKNHFVEETRKYQVLEKLSEKNCGNIENMNVSWLLKKLNQAKQIKKYLQIRKIVQKPNKSWSLGWSDENKQKF